MTRRVEVEIVADTREFRRGLAVARQSLWGVVGYAGRGWSTPEFERMVARIRRWRL